MDQLKLPWHIHRWQEKLLALVVAVLIWFFVDQSIVITRTIPHIPVRITHIPPDKTISGLLPNGIYHKRVKLILSGTRHVLESIEPGDIELVLDASVAPEEWLVEITKKNVVALNPDLDLTTHLKTVSQPDLVIRLSRSVTSQVPVYILPPKGEAPEGYSIIDVTPFELSQVLTGPQEEIQDLERTGVGLEWDLSKITKEEIDALALFQDNEVYFPVPSSWKKVKVPFVSPGFVPLNDPRSQDLKIVFLKEEPIPIQVKIPIIPFYPLETRDRINPTTTPFIVGNQIGEENGIFHLETQVLLGGTNQVFTNLVAPYLAILVRVEKEAKEPLNWNLVLFQSRKLEDDYVSLLKGGNGDWGEHLQEKTLRSRFRVYLKSMRLLESKDIPLRLIIRHEKDGLRSEPLESR